MKYRKYIVIAFVAALFLPLLSAKAEKKVTNEDLDIRNITFTEQELEAELDFNTSDYLPEGFDAYKDEVSVKSLQFVEDEIEELGFDTKEYLPKGFNPYKK
ncbi:hypothetical protein [uncultured Croceitalea sp.]|uniref:hypothetical protein n=1 Tax=uncultured Croceitalea sp. TaxID=1798908 RepID=UPI0033065056